MPHPSVDLRTVTIVFASLLVSCSSGEAPDEVVVAPDSPGSEQTGGEDTSPGPSEPGPTELADVTEVRTSGASGAYSFSVTIRSPDTGCDQYADWWEVLTDEGTLVYRRILAHSHVDEQPFTRSGGPVSVQATDPIVVRAHMNEAGYGGVAFSGTVASGFAASSSIDGQFAPDLAKTEPLPSGCAF